jgi:hypothetical protein
MNAVPKAIRLTAPFSSSAVVEAGVGDDRQRRYRPEVLRDVFDLDGARPAVVGVGLAEVDEADSHSQAPYKPIKYGAFLYM